MTLALACTFAFIAGEVLTFLVLIMLADRDGNL